MNLVFYTAPLLVQPQQYDCTIRRFLAYSYANNNPIPFKDPSGLEPEGEKGRDEVQSLDPECLTFLELIQAEVDLAWEAVDKSRARDSESGINRLAFSSFKKTVIPKFGFSQNMSIDNLVTVFVIVGEVCFFVELPPSSFFT